MRGIIHSEATITEPEKPIKIPEAPERLGRPHQALKHKCRNFGVGEGDKGWRVRLAAGAVPLLGF